MHPKIFILFSFKAGPWGGCNQFLNALKKQFLSRGILASSPINSKFIIFDSYNKIIAAIFLKFIFPNKFFIHRIDGPISFYRNTFSSVDSLIYKIGYRIADGIIFQSEYSKQSNLRLNMPIPKFSKVIVNAPDNNIFYKKNDNSRKLNNKIKIISASWSSNYKKGFDIYNFLDKNLNFNKYEMTFVGNSIFKFKNIVHISPVDSILLAEKLRSSDVFLTASINDPCSNIVLEAMSCGLPVVARKSGGHAEIISKGGVTFNGKLDVLDSIDKLCNDYFNYKNSIPNRTIKRVCDDYVTFCFDFLKNKIEPKKISFFNITKLLITIIFYFASQKFINFSKKMKK